VVRVRELAVPIEETAEHSAVVAYNVLEHIPDDVAALRAFAGLLRPGRPGRAGRPGLPERDERVRPGHRATSGATGGGACAPRPSRRAAVEVLHHVNCIGLLGWYVAVKALKGRPKAGCC
jgi:hypothetical protein